MNTGLISREDSNYEKAVTLRYELFFRDHNLPKSVTCDEYEEQSFHFATTNESNLIAYGRLTDLGQSEYKISQLVVAPPLQRKGYGKALLKYMVDFARKKGAEILQLNAQTSAKRLYEGLGFIGVGDVYEAKLTKVPHIKMVLHLSSETAVGAN